MIRIYQILAILILTSCGQMDKSQVFLEYCPNSNLDLTRGIEVTDSLGYFSYRIPDSTWRPLRTIGKNENGLTVGDTSKGYLIIFNVNQSNFRNPWDWDEKQKNLEKEFNVIETGDMMFQGNKCRYNIVLFEQDIPKMITFYLTVLDTVKYRNYTLNLSTEKHENYKTRICEMKPLIESFRIKN